MYQSLNVTEACGKKTGKERGTVCNREDGEVYGGEKFLATLISQESRENGLNAG
jgi:hypothetical protein